MRCLNCRQKGIDLTAQVCPQCGVDLTNLVQDLLPPGTFLDGRKYRINLALAQNRFGITYQATDLILNRSVAIREFLPQAYAKRKKDSS
jgi:hypothetical protein